MPLPRLCERDRTIDTSRSAIRSEAARASAPVLDIGLFGRPWDLALLAACFRGVRRFGQVRECLGICRKTLAQPLTSLVEDDILVRLRHQSRPERFEYVLTEKGRDLFPIVLAIRGGGERWGAATHDDGWHVEHLPCHHACGTSVVCDHCTEPVHLADVSLTRDR